jgi:hypothetical protein
MIVSDVFGMGVPWLVVAELTELREHLISVAKEVKLSPIDVEIALWKAGMRSLLRGKSSFSKHERGLDAM